MKALKLILSFVLFSQFSFGQTCIEVAINGNCVGVRGDDEDMTLTLHDHRTNKTVCIAGDCSSDPNSNGHHAEGLDSSKESPCGWGESCSQGESLESFTLGDGNEKNKVDNANRGSGGQSGSLDSQGGGGSNSSAVQGAIASGLKSYFDSRVWYDQQRDVERQTQNRRNATKNEMESLHARSENLSRKFEQERQSLLAKDAVRRQQQSSMKIPEYIKDPILENTIDPMVEAEYRLKETAIAKYELKLKELVRQKAYVSAVKIVEALSENKLSSYSQNIYFSKDGILTPESIDSRIPASPFSKNNLISLKGTPYGQIIRRATNQFQALWAEQQGYRFAPKLHRAYAATAALLLRKMDSLFGKASLSELQIYLHQYNVLLRFLGGIGVSFLNTPASLYEGITLFPDLFKKWIQEHNDDFNDFPHSVSVLAETGVNIADLLAESLIQGLYDDGQKILSMDPDQLGDVAGSFIANRILGKILHGSNSKSSVIDAGSEKVAEVQDSLGKLLKPIFQDKEFQNFSIQTLEEVRDLDSLASPGFRDLIRRKASEDMATAVDGVRAYASLKNIPGNSLLKDQAEEIARLVMQEKRQTRDFLNGVIDSQRMPSQRFTSLQTAADIPRLSHQYDMVDQSVRQVQASLKSQGVKEIHGVRARYIPKSFTDADGNTWKNYPENAFKPHAGTAITRNRLGYGGPSGELVISSGFGSTSEEAARVARGEVVSYGGNPEAMLLATQSVKADNFKVLDFRDKFVGRVFQERGLNEKLTIDRKDIHGYDFSNMLGHSARRQGYDGVILFSEPDMEIKKGFNFHKFLE